MLADLVDHVIGVDPAKSVFMAVIVDSRTSGEIEACEFRATADGYRAALEWADEAGTTADRRAWAIEGTGSYGSGLFQILDRCGEWAIEFGHPKTPASTDGTKTDQLDAARAARETLGRQNLTVPRARGPREGLRCLLMARDGAQTSRTRAINELKSLVLTAPVELRDQLDGQTTAALVATCARFRPTGTSEVYGTKIAMRSLARRVNELTAEAADLKDQIEPAVHAFAPQLLNEYGIGPIVAAQIIVAWSHKGRFPTEAAFARFAGTAPLLASTGGADVIRHRLSRRGDRTLNKALHTIALVRIGREPRTQTFIDQKLAQGKSRSEARRILKRYIARRIYRLLENPPN